ncbi:hypothetical protein D3C75_1163220 [compost metagenome]
MLLDQPVDPEVLLVQLLDAVMGVPDFMYAQTQSQQDAGIEAGGNGGGQVEAVRISYP